MREIKLGGMGIRFKLSLNKVKHARKLPSRQVQNHFDPPISKRIPSLDIAHAAVRGGDYQAIPAPYAARGAGSPV